MEITDEQYELIAPLLAKTCRPPDIPHRQLINALLYVLKSGCSWRQVPKEYGNWHTIYTRFKRWSESGLFWKILRTLQGAGALKVKITSLDSTTVRAHHCASGAQIKKGHSPLAVQAVA